MNNVMALNVIKGLAENIQAFLEITVSDNPEEVTDRGHDLTVYLAQTAKMLADAKYHLSKAKKGSILRNQTKPLSPTIMRELVNSDTEDESYIVNWVERLNRACTHELDWLRSVLSKMKEELRMQGYQRG